MKISISFPPIASQKGVPLLTQNRQFQWFYKPTYIYPMVPASMATLLKANGHEVLWDDGIAEEISYKAWLDRIIISRADVVFLESKTPVIKKHWAIINELKDMMPKAKLVLYGDHVTALPEESLTNSKADFVMIGGDYDFLALKLLNYLTKKTKELGSGFAYIDKSNLINTGFFESTESLDNIPMIDRTLTKWKQYAYKNGNYKYTPGTYTMFGRDCWWRGNGGCKFCSWTNTHRAFKAVSVERALQEIGQLVDLGVKEIFDDTGTFPVGAWLKKFCHGMIERGFNKKIIFGCNMRPSALTFEEYQLMKEAGFRLVLFGLESANQETLNKINKGATIEEIVKGLQHAARAKLDGHITTMIGYPWETKADATKTIELAKALFKNGHVATLQATVVIPYPGTALHKECQENKWLVTEDYDEYDQRQQIMKSALSTDDVLGYTRDLYKTFLTPKFIIKKFLSIRSINDVKFFTTAGLRVFGHLKDFSGKKANNK